MKFQRKFYAFVIVASCSLLTYCKPKGDLPAVKTLSLDSSNHEFAWLSGQVLDDGGNPITSRGMCVSIDSDVEPTITSSTGNVYWTSDSSGMGIFTSKITAKWTGKKQSVRNRHYIRAYATNKVGTGYGETIEFMPKSKPLTADIVSFREPQADYHAITITFNIKPNGCYVQEFKLCYGNKTKPTIDGLYIDIPAPFTELPIKVDSLNAAQTYYFRFYMKNDEGFEIYSEEVNATTKSEG